MAETYITIVSGLPRSGTSLMMQMLSAGGMPVLSDGLRAADGDNPRGYFEFERVKKLKEDAAWLAEAEGKAVKMVYKLLYHLPHTHRYRVLLMRRHLDEVVKSQARMLQRQGKDPGQLEDSDLIRIFAAHLEKVVQWMQHQPSLEFIEVSYNELLKDPLPAAQRVNRFLDGRLDTEKMAAAVEPGLHRNRSAQP